jgi:hypothetical protein
MSLFLLFGGKYSYCWIWNDIGRNCLLGHGKKRAKFLLRIFTCRSTFLYGLKQRPLIHFIFIRNKCRVYLYLKKRRNTPQRPVTPIQSGITARCRYQWRLAHFFFHFNLLGRVWKPAADYYGCLARFKFKKSAINDHFCIYSAGCHTRPDHSAE